MANETKNLQRRQRAAAKRSIYWAGVAKREQEGLARQGQRCMVRSDRVQGIRQ